MAQAGCDAGRASWLPSDEDRAYVMSLMQPVATKGKRAAWIAPPEKGIKDKPVDYEYVRLAWLIGFHGPVHHIDPVCE